MSHFPCAVAENTPLTEKAKNKNIHRDSHTRLALHAGNVKTLDRLGLHVCCHELLRIQFVLIAGSHGFLS